MRLQVLSLTQSSVYFLVNYVTFTTDNSYLILANKGHSIYRDYILKCFSFFLILKLEYPSSDLPLSLPL